MSEKISKQSMDYAMYKAISEGRHFEAIDTVGAALVRFSYYLRAAAGEALKAARSMAP